MVKDAEAHASDDKKRRELAEGRNQLDSLIYTTEKSMKEFSDKVDAGDKQNIEDALAKARKALESNDVAAIKSAQEQLTNSSHKLAEAMYAKASQGGAKAGAGPEPGAQEGPRPKAQEDVVDADSKTSARNETRWRVSAKGRRESSPFCIPPSHSPQEEPCGVSLKN